MKDILGHKAWSEHEILEFFDVGSFTMCKLPHYRYQRVQSICANLKACGLIKKVGDTETGVNYIATEKYHEWRQATSKGEETTNLIKLFKKLNPRKPKNKKCSVCNNEFSTLNYTQKYCSKSCKPKWKVPVSKEGE